MTNTPQSPVIDFEQATTPQSLVISDEQANQIKNIPTLPQHGVSRERQLLPFLPFSSSTLWDWSSKGKFISPVKLSPTMTVWDNAKVHKWLDSVAKGYDPELATQLATQLAETSQTDNEGA